ncbi:hypothetical protein [Burkholderia cenocepacia]|uniref:hypothetical protein n=1 Tax=Burkholderia cenocepacia TaxID=95486 RepID=UPI00158BBCEE|nr:hypothetical protein [Burkholderia cenocepacia]
MGVQMLGAVLAALEPDTPTLRPLFGKAVPDVASRRLDAPREDRSMALISPREGADFLVI